MGKAQYVFLCLALVLPVLIAQPVLPPSYIVVDNLTHYPLEYSHHITYKDGSFVNSELQTLNEYERLELLVEDTVASIRTSYSIVAPGPMMGSWNTNPSWSILPDGEAEETVYWTIDDAGFWLGYEDPVDFPESETTKECDWRTTNI